MKILSSEKGLLTGYYEPLHHISYDRDNLYTSKEINSKILYDFLGNLIKNKNFIDEKKRNMIEFNKLNFWDYNLKILKKTIE